MLMVQLQTQRLITSVPKGNLSPTMRLIGSCLLALVLLCGCGVEPLPVESWTEEELGKIRSRMGPGPATRPNESSGPGPNCASIW